MNGKEHLIMIKSKELQQPVIVFVCFDDAWYPKTIRHYDWIVKGVQEVEKELKKLSIPLYLFLGNPEEKIKSYIDKYNISVVIYVRISYKFICSCINVNIRVT